jgi:hypothetical protein
MQKNAVSTPNFRDVLAKPLLEVVVKEDLEYLLKVSCKDFAETIDFSKGYEIIEEDIPPLVAETEPNNAYALFAKATLKTGKICRFVANTVWLGRDKYAVAIQKMPNHKKKSSLMPPNQAA